MPNIYDCANNLEKVASEVNRTVQFVSKDDNYLWFDYSFNIT